METSDSYEAAKGNLSRLCEAFDRVISIDPVFRRLRMWEELIKTAETVVKREELKRE